MLPHNHIINNDVIHHQAVSSIYSVSQMKIPLHIYYVWTPPLRPIHSALIIRVEYHLDTSTLVESSWNVMPRGDAWAGKWRGNWRMEWVASTLHTTSEHGVSSITTTDAHTSAASSRLTWRPCRFKWTHPFRRKTKSGFCACAITFQRQSTTNVEDWKLGHPHIQHSST
jgi:hypothetical protein